VVLTGCWPGPRARARWAIAVGRRARPRPLNLHPLALMFVLSGSLMISKTLRIPKL
jgi:hypothetical protein